MQQTLRLALLLFSACSVVEDITPPLEESDTPEDTSPVIDTDTPPPATDVSLLINEVMPGNASTVGGPGNQFADWVEVVNTGATSVAWSRISLQDKDGVVIQGGDGELAPGARALIWLNENSAFTLDKEGDEVSLLADGVVLDRVVFGDLGSDVAYARTPDLNDVFHPTARATPNAVNEPTPSSTLDPATETLFVTTKVHQIHFGLTPQQYRDINDGMRNEVHATAEIDGVSFPDIGLSLKGSGSYQPMEGKPAFIVDMNAWVPGTRFRGVKGFRLHNGYIFDATRVHEHITYTLARESGLMAPRVGWAEVYVNREYYGIYPLVELHDDEMIAQFYPDQEDIGVMLEPNEGFGDFGRGQVMPGTVLPCWEEGPLPADPQVIETLQAIDRIVRSSPNDNNVAELWDYVERDRFLDFLAWEAITTHIDGYLATNNWRLFVNGTTYKAEWVPSGAEWTWDNGLAVLQTSAGSAKNFCLANQNCRREYARHLLQIADRVEALDLETEFVDISTWLDPLIDADPRYNSAFGSGPQVVENDRRATRTSLQNNPDAVRDAVRAEFPGLTP